MRKLAIIFIAIPLCAVAATLQIGIAILTLPLVVIAYAIAGVEL